MTNMVRKVRFSVGIGEMHSTYSLLESIKLDQGLHDPFLESMRILLKRKIMEEEEGLLSVAFTVRDAPRVRKYSNEGLGFDTPVHSPVKEVPFTKPQSAGYKPHEFMPEVQTPDFGDAPSDMNSPEYHEWMARKYAIPTTGESNNEQG